MLLFLKFWPQNAREEWTYQPFKRIHNTVRFKEIRINLERLNVHSHQTKNIFNRDSIKVKNQLKTLNSILVFDLLLS